MAKSSINIQAGKGYNYLAHNDRTNPTVNSIFFDEKNEVSCSAKEAHHFFKLEIGKRIELYQKKKKRKLHKNTILHLSSVVNLNENHTLEDVKKVADFLEEALDTKVFQIAIHRDEGHIDKNGKAVKNYHAHIEFLGLDSQGQSVRRKLTKGSLSQIQSMTAQILGMERGINYARAKKPRPKRLSCHEYKRVAKAESKAEQDKAKSTNIIFEVGTELMELKRANKQLRSELQLAHAEREQYAKLEATNKQLRVELSDGKIELSDALTQIDQLKNELFETIEAKNEAENGKEVAEHRLDAKNGSVAEFGARIDKLEAENAELRDENSKLKDFVSAAKNLIVKVLKLKHLPFDHNEAIKYMKEKTKELTPKKKYTIER